MYAILMQVADRTSDGLTFAEILTGIPHDGPAFFLYALTAGAVGWVIWANRKAKPKGPSTGATA
jgi:hypothetical protein